MANRYIRTGKNFNCQTCNNEFYRSPWQIKRGGEEKMKFCSLYCRRHTEETKNNMRVTKKGSVPPNKGKKGLQIAWNKGLPNFALRGENHFNWKGGVTPAHFQVRHSIEMKIWRRGVFERDDYTCKICNKRGSRNLHADHIKPFCNFPELRFELDNGRTLCESCHKKTSTYGKGAIKFTKQYCEYLDFT